MTTELWSILVLMLAILITVACLLYLYIGKLVIEVSRLRTEARIVDERITHQSQLWADSVSQMNDRSQLVMELGENLIAARQPEAQASVALRARYGFEPPKPPGPTAFERILKDDADDFPEPDPEKPGKPLEMAPMKVPLV